MCFDIECMPLFVPEKPDIVQYLSANKLNPALFNVSRAKYSFNWAYFYVRHFVGHEQSLDGHHLILRDDFNITVVPDIRKCSFIELTLHIDLVIYLGSFEEPAFF